MLLLTTTLPHSVFGFVTTTHTRVHVVRTIHPDAMIKLVENACSEMLLAPDWTLNMQIVDDLNRERDPVV